MSICLFVCLLVCPSHFLTPFNGLFGPTSRSTMSKLFRYSESLGKRMERSGLRFEHFCSKMVYNRRVGKLFFTDLFPLFTPFKRLFAPTSRSPMSKLFRYSESLGKSNGKKWSQIWKLLLIKGVKSPRKKKFLVFGKFCLTSRIFFYRCYYPHRSRDALSPVCGILFICYNL